MENQKQNLTLSPKESQKLALRESPEHGKKLDSLIAGCLTLQKLYGRDLGDAGTVINLFHQLLGKYPGAKVISAFEVWLERGQEFPTPADIINLIKRNGRPPLKESDVIAVRRKDGEDRTKADWDLLREWDAQQREGFEEDFSEEKQASLIQDNARMRVEIINLKAEIERLGVLVNKLRFERNESQSLASPMMADKQTKIQRTIDFMRQTNTPESDIKQFALEQGVVF